MRILLIEDEPMNTAFFRAVMEHEGHDVTSEASGLLGRQIALRESFDLIITDIDLPGIDGVTVCRDLQRAGIVTPVVALSAFDEAWVREREVGGVGFARFLMKPITPEDLRAAIRGFSGGARELAR